MPIIVTGSFDLDPAKRDAAIEVFTACMVATRTEEGNDGYTFSADLEDAGRFHLVEHWASQQAIDAHMASPHLAELMGAMGALGVTGVSLTQWNGATGQKLM
jgi:quinol monooxygenase YgiN